MASGQSKTHANMIYRKCQQRQPAEGNRWGKKEEKGVWGAGERRGGGRREDQKKCFNSSMFLFFFFFYFFFLFLFCPDIHTQGEKESFMARGAP